MASNTRQRSASSSAVINDENNPDKQTLCGICKKDIIESPTAYKQMSIECECCIQWFHTQDQLKHDLQSLRHRVDKVCTDMTAKQIETDAKIEDKLKIDTKQLETNVLESVNSTLNDRIDARIQETLNNPAQPNNPAQLNNPAQQNTSPTTTRNIVTTQVKEAMAEREDQQSRKLNLMIHNLAEPDDLDAEVAQMKVLIESKLKIDEEIVVTEYIRLGNLRADGKPRLLKITLQSLSMKRKMLSCATKLRQLPELDTYAKVYLKPDLTKKQQEESKNLYENLKRQRVSDPENQYIISKGRIIQKPPT